MSEKACNDICRAIPKAMYLKKEEDSIFVNERMRDEVEDSFILKTWGFKGAIQPTENKRKITKTKGMQKPTGFDEEDYELEECLADNYETADFKVANDNSNHRDLESSSSAKTRPCETEICDVESAMGFRITESFDWKKKYKSEILCAEELYEHGPKNVREHSDFVKKSVSDFAIFNLKQHLLRQSVLRGGANTSIFTANPGQNLVSQGGFNSAPVSYLTIPHLKAWRQYLQAEGGLRKTNGYLVIGGPAEDFIRAIAKYEEQYLNNKSIINRDPYMDKEGMMKGREYLQYDMIRYYINETPMKAVMIPNGSKITYRHIYPTIDSTDHTFAGVGDKVNPNYYNEFSEIDGKFYRNVTFYHLSIPDSACRWGLLPPTNPEASVLDSQGKMSVITGAYIDCNEDNYKWYYRLENRIRLRVDVPEHLGACIALSRPAGGSIAFIDEPTTTPPAGKPCGPEVEPEEFAKCGALECEDPCNDTPCTEKVELNLSPCPTAKFLFEGDVLNGAVRIKLLEAPCEAGTVDFKFVDDTAVFDTDFTSSLGASGTIQLVEGCSKDIVIPVSVLNVTPDADPNIIAKITATLALGNATGGVELGDCDSITLCFEDAVVDCPVSDDCVPTTASKSAKTAEIVVPDSVDSSEEKK